MKNDTGKRLDRAFRLALGRLPDQSERKAFLRFLEEQVEDLAKDEQAVRKIAGERELAAWTLACSVLLNLDETITRP